MAIAIKVENLSKIYRLGEIGTGTVSRDIERWVKTRLLGQDDPFLRIGESNDRSTKGKSDIVYSLQDINFEIEQGDAVGIIGRNGAGKSTLLKILSRVTAPTKGRISVKGRIASLLEVGTGFHPDLTGRENIYLNGSMLGMRKKEIDRRLDEIIDFSGVERYIDTPVKRYSSGMYVRLAFAVAAHLESEILIVDEVLAVGDAEFQQKCLGKMGDVSRGEGRTVLFVSHNMGAVSTFCNRGLVLDKGFFLFDGLINKAISEYNNCKTNSKYESYDIEIFKPCICKATIDMGNLDLGNILLKVGFKSPFSIDYPVIGVVFYSLLGVPLFGTNSRIHPLGFIPQSRNQGTMELFIPNIPLHSGTYKISLWFGDKAQDYDYKQDILSFDFISKTSPSNIPDTTIIGSFNVLGFWQLKNEEELN